MFFSFKLSPVCTLYLSSCAKLYIIVKHKSQLLTTLALRPIDINSYWPRLIALKCKVIISLLLLCKLFIDLAQLQLSCHMK